MRLRRLLAILAAGLLFLAACGDDDDSGDDAAPETTDAPADTDDTTDNGDGTGDGDVDLPSGFTSEECEQFIEAYTGAAAALSGSADFGELAEFLDDIAEKVPDEIRDDFEVFAAAMKDFAKAAEEAGIDFSDPSTMTPEKFQEIAEESAALNEGEVQEATQNLQAWGEENCTG